ERHQPLHEQVGRFVVAGPRGDPLLTNLTPRITPQVYGNDSLTKRNVKGSSDFGARKMGEDGVIWQPFRQAPDVEETVLLVWVGEDLGAGAGRKEREIRQGPDRNGHGPDPRKAWEHHAAPITGPAYKPRDNQRDIPPDREEMIRDVTRVPQIKAGERAGH